MLLQPLQARTVSTGFPHPAFCGDTASPGPPADLPGIFCRRKPAHPLALILHIPCPQHCSLQGSHRSDDGLGLGHPLLCPPRAAPDGHPQAAGLGSSQVPDPRMAPASVTTCVPAGRGDPETTVVTQPTAAHRAERKHQGQADPLSRWKYLREPWTCGEHWQGTVGASCHPTQPGTEPWAGSALPHWPERQQHLWPGQGCGHSQDLQAQPRPPTWGRANPAAICPCRCSSTAAALKPNAACAQAARASPLPRPGHSTRISSRPPRHTGTAALQHPAWASLHGTGPTAATGTAPCPAQGKVLPSTPHHPAHPAPPMGPFGTGACATEHQRHLWPGSAQHSAVPWPAHGQGCSARRRQIPGAVKREHIEARGRCSDQRPSLTVRCAPLQGTAHKNGGAAASCHLSSPQLRILVFPLRGTAGPPQAAPRAAPSGAGVISQGPPLPRGPGEQGWWCSGGHR